MNTQSISRTEVEFTSQGETCRAWVYTPPETSRSPIIVMAHGLGGVREMRLDAFAERFCEAGYACLVFDYRHFGASEGLPRQLLSVKKQLQDWRAAADFARCLPGIDPQQVVLWGTSFSGGHVFATGVALPWVKAIISQGPFTNGFASIFRSVINSGAIASLKMTWAAIADGISSLFGADPKLVPLAGEKGSFALMASDDAKEGVLRLVPEQITYASDVTARVVLGIFWYYPGRKIKHLSCPAFICVCTEDSVAPAAATLRYARRSACAVVKTYDAGHFDIYVGEDFETVVTDQIEFLNRHLSQSGKGVQSTP